MTAITWGRACEGKRQQSRQAALRAVAWRESHGAPRGSLNAYPCPFDPTHWHVGHVPGRGKRTQERS